MTGGRPLTVVATNEAARERGVKAGELVRTAAKTLGGGGGGKDDVAQGGGQQPGRPSTRRSRPSAGWSPRRPDAHPIRWTRRGPQPRPPAEPRGRTPCDAAGGSPSMSATPGSGSPPATRTACWPPRWRPCPAGTPRRPAAGIAAIVEEYEPIEVVVGLPRSLSGAEGPGGGQGQGVRRRAGEGRRARCRCAWWTSGCPPSPPPRGCAPPGCRSSKGRAVDRPGGGGGDPAERPGDRTRFRKSARGDRRSGHLIAVR